MGTTGQSQRSEFIKSYPQTLTVQQFPLDKLKEVKIQSRGRGNHGNKSKIRYLDIVSAFDIETTRLKDVEQSIMYIWQWHFTGIGTLIGRTLEELNSFIEKLTSYLPENVYLCTFIHNASYEFQFLRGIYNFSENEVFCLDTRKILKFEMFMHFEFRCSYIHSNMSLSEYCKKMGVKHQKLSGADFDYNKIRYPWTKLTAFELAYCVHDVIGLCEAITIDMKSTSDNFYTFPLTSTGYVRRDTKRAMKTVRHNFVKEIFPDAELFAALREAFRGGNTHANRWYAGITLFNVGSVDISSSYPYSQTNCLMPVSKFYHVGECAFEELIKMMDVYKYALLVRVALHNVRLKNDRWGCPYLSRDKCRQIINAEFDNGRILEAEYLTTTITDIDLRILISEYDFADIVIYDCWRSRYGKLPRVLIDETITYYRDKTTLKQDPNSPTYDAALDLYYGKQKAKLNSIYGMMAQNPVKSSIKFYDGDYHIQDIDISEELQKRSRYAFLTYQWGVWITAWSRYNLERGMQELEAQNTSDNPTAFVYCDTDSIKYLGNFDLSRLNAERIKSSTDTGTFAYDPKGNCHYMGVFEDEGRYKEFKTLGAKKYAYRDKDGKLHVTIAGVNKKLGAEELERAGGLDAFEPGFTFTDAGGTEAVYNDHPDIVYKVGKRKIKITSNVVIRESTYRLGLAGDYGRLLQYISDSRNDDELTDLY